MPVNMLRVFGVWGIGSRRKGRKGYDHYFTVARISEDLFWQLLADGDMSRIILLCNGCVEDAWDKTIPDENIIRAKVSVDGLTGSEGEKVGG
jgi:hypothetical protein